MSSAFQAHLEGSPLNGLQQPLHLAYGSIVTIKSHRSVGPPPRPAAHVPASCLPCSPFFSPRHGGGLLHSHPHFLPEDLCPQNLKLQQITAYMHKDDNNKWIVKKVTSTALCKAQR